VRACVRGFVRAWVHACENVRACMHGCVSVRSNVCSVATVYKLLNISGIHLRRLI